MPLENIDLDSGEMIAAEPVPLDLHGVIVRSIDAEGINATAEHMAAGLELGSNRATVMEVINDCITGLI